MTELKSRRIGKPGFALQVILGLWALGIFVLYYRQAIAGIARRVGLVF
ncbi:hypothetical protein ACFL42_04660 [Candidatus Omnitrophota bacterium]